MILLLATSYRRRIAFLLFLLFHSSFLFSSLANTKIIYPLPTFHPATFNRKVMHERRMIKDPRLKTEGTVRKEALPSPPARNIGGPSQPEMSTFKSVGTDNMVDLFTGAFSYNIPLMDVGGYPVNIFYSGEISLEQEASWVGLGWNINPGNINRNMRGVPDDFNGEEKLIQTQNMKPNKTFGVSLGADLEGLGIKHTSLGLDLGANLGVSWNNYLGPALDFGVKGGVAFKVLEKTIGEKGGNISANLKAGFSADVNSRSGFTLSPNVSLTASTFINERTISAGMGVSTSYNSRSGIKELQISEQMSASHNDQECKINKQKKVTKAIDKYSIGERLFSTSISFARPSYIPSIRMPLLNEAISGHFQLGAGIFGAYGSVEAEVYKQTSSVSKEKIVQKKPLVGYLHAENAMSNAYTVMDFTRFNDREVTAHTPIISAPQYSCDVFSIQGEGTGGSIRAYRTEPGFVRDNITGSQDKSIGVGVDIGIPGHFGANVNLIQTPSTIGEWRAGNGLHSPLAFLPSHTGSWENVYFRNPGESSVLNSGQFTAMGGTDLVRFKLTGNSYSPAIQPMLDRFSKDGAFIGSVSALPENAPARKRRSQVIDFLTAGEASVVGLDKTIKSYDNQTILNNDTLLYTPIDRVGDVRKKHHISQVNVTESNGRRYIYGIPVYNTLQKDFTFTVKNSDLSTPGSSDKIGYETPEINPLTNTAITDDQVKRDGYAQTMETPGFAHSFLLSGLLSPNYVDVKNDGITEDDLGDAVKFNYTRMKNASGGWAVHRWRTPIEGNMANFNPGKRSDVKDDKGLVSYGERESWYLHSIESKTMIALFLLEDRDDGKGVLGENGGVDGSDRSIKRLKEIRLYSKSDLKKNGIAGAKPIKTVHFTYSYTLCPGTPGNIAGTGKLTLDGIYFTYNGQNKANKSRYIFSYLNKDGSGNPAYVFNATDRWGTYKPASMNPAGLKNSDYPYTPQDKVGQTPREALDQNAGAWALKGIVLPSGGQIEVQYESKDYAFVQNRRAAEMLSIAGFGRTSSSMSNRLFDLPSGDPMENLYVFVNIPDPCHSRQEVYLKYLQGMDQIAVKLAVNMPKGVEHLLSYANFDDYGIVDDTKIWIHLKPVNGLSPLSLTAVEFLREQLPGQAFPGYDLSESAGIQQIGEALAGMLYSLKNAFSDPVRAMRSEGKAQIVVLDQSFIRLNDPDGVKFGGGQRVRSIRLKDNWQAMTKQYNSVYEKQYEYTTKEVFNGAERVISSGVASYEPSLGGEENPFQTILQVADKLPLGPISYGAVEMPVLDGFFPAPIVGYSKVTVRSIPSVKPQAGQRSRSGIGRQVTEYYTAKDYPVYYSNTALDPTTDLQAHDASTTAFFYKYAFDSRALSQGFLIELNDMHGKLKAESSYAENDTTLRVNYMENFYRNTGVAGLNEQFDFVSAAQGGAITTGNMGIDVELMTDTREFSVQSNSYEIQGQVDLFPILFPFWLPFIWPVTGNSENNYRAVTTTKVINYHSILDSTVVFDKGSQVSTKNMIYDGETGAVIVTRTNNEFNQSVYKTSYPAWWAYGGMGPAYANIGVNYANVNFYDGRIVSPGFDQSLFESGDELYITNPGSPAPGCISPSVDVPLLWVLDINKNRSSLTTVNRDLIYIDSIGRPFTKNNVSFRIVRSGKRNLLDAKLENVTSMVSPVVPAGTDQKLLINSSSNVIDASAAEFKEKWNTDKDNIGKFLTVYNPSICDYEEVPNPSGHLEKYINPYRKGLLGNFSPFRSMLFYGDRKESDLTEQTNLPKNGFLKEFKLYWDFNSSNALTPDLSNAKWVWNSELTKINTKGLELETRDPLMRYTSAQYGFDKNMPLSIVQNARTGEAFNEGFEDYEYSEQLNKPNASSNNDRYIDLTSAGTIINTDGSASIKAHSGKYVLKVNKGTVGVRTIDVVSDVKEDFHLNIFKDTSLRPYQTGGTINSSQIEPFVPADNDFMYQTPQALWEGITNFSNGGFFLPQVTIRDTFLNNNKTRRHYFDVTNTYYIDVLQSGYYNFRVHYGKNETGCHFTALSLIVNMERVDGGDNPSRVYNFSLWNDYQTDYTNVFVCKGLYKVTSNIKNFMQWSLIDDISNDWPYDIFWPQNPSTTYPCGFYKNRDWGWYISNGEWPDLGNNSWGYPEIYFSTNAANVSYKSVSTINGCITTRPIAATDSMLNPSFFVAPGKKMLFSGWVREACAPPCTNVSYSDSKVELDFGSAGALVSLKPTGAIIDGWQKVEGEFTVPQTATTMKLRLVNSGTAENYWDDIRIHPFNSDMKSYVYDPVNLRLVAELDANNYATFYEYDEEGGLVRTKVETREGIRTVSETRSAKQKNINEIK